MNDIIIDKSIEQIIARLKATQRYYENERRSHNINKAELDASKLKDVINNESVLRQVKKMMSDLRLPESSGFLRKKSSRELIVQLVSDLSHEKDILSIRISNNIDEAPMMDEELYKIYLEQSRKNKEFVDSEIIKFYSKMKKYIPKRNETDLEKASWLVKTFGVHTIINDKQIGPIYEVATGKYIEKDGKIIPEMLEFDDILKACIYFEQQNIEKKQQFLSTYDVTDIEKELKKQEEFLLRECDSLFSYNDDIQIKKNEIKSNIKKLIEYKRSKEILKKILERLTNLNLIDYNFQKKLMNIESQMNQEIEELDKLIIKLNEKVISEQNSLRNEIMQLQKSETKLEKLKPKENLESKEDKNEKDAYANLQKLAHKTSSVHLEEQRKLYERYTRIRKEIDQIAEQTENIEDFKRKVEEQLRFLGVGTNYDEIMENMYEMREQLDVTQTIKDIVFQSRLIFNGNVDVMNREGENGLTNFENMINGQMEALSMQEGLTNELRSELYYYMDRHAKLSGEMRYVYQNKSQYDIEDYEKIVHDKKYRYYIDTYLLEEMGLKSQLSSRIR